MSKKFNSAIARVRNSAGEFEALPALRGLDSYQLAVQNGFEGTEEEWMNSIIGDGWVGAYQQLEAEQTKIKSKQTEIENQQELIVDKQTEIKNKQTELESDIGEITPASIEAAALDDNGKVTAEQTCSTIKEISDSEYTLVASDAGKFLITRNEETSGQDYTVIVPDDGSNEVFPVGTEIEILRYYPGTITITFGAETILLKTSDTSLPKGASVTIPERYGVVVLKKIMADRWLIKGEFE